MPGEASVTSELSDEDWLSSGSLSNRPRSTSVCVVDTVSSRSPAASTFTVVDAVPSCRLAFTSRGTGVLTATSCTLA